MQYYSDELIELAKTDSIVAECMEAYPEDPMQGMHEMVLLLSGSYRVTVETFTKIMKVMR